MPQRAIAVLLSIVLVISLCPIPGFAAPAEPSSSSSAQSETASSSSSVADTEATKTAATTEAAPASAESDSPSSSQDLGAVTGSSAHATVDANDGAKSDNETSSSQAAPQESASSSASSSSSSSTKPSEASSSSSSSSAQDKEADKEEAEADKPEQTKEEAAEEEELEEEAIEAEEADAGEEAVVEGTLNLIQEGNWWPPEGTEDKDVQFGSSSLSTTKIEQMKNRLNTQFMNPPTSGTSITVSLSDMKIPWSEYTNLKTWLEDVINSNPDLFYMSSSYRATGASSGGTMCVNTVSVNLSMSASQIKSYRTKYETAMQNAMKWIPATANDVQKIKAAHDWLVRNVAYHTQAASTGSSSWKSAYGNLNPWSAYGAFVDKKAVCEGYSLAFIAILKRVGIEATFVTQHKSSYDGHGWNRVKANGKWYNVDVTFDDPTPDGGSGRTPSTTYFMKSDKWFKSHPYDGWHTTWTPAGTAATDTTYDSYSWNTYSGNASDSSSNPTSLMITTPANTKQSAPFTMLIDSRLQLTIATTQNSNILPGRATWSSSNPSVVAVNSAGLVTTGDKEGTATITCKLGSRTAYCYIRVVKSGTNMSAVSKSIVWSDTSYIGNNTVKYDGRNHRPQNLNITYKGKTLTKGKDYTVEYSNSTDGNACVLPGTCTITIFGIGEYIGTTTLTYYIRGDLAQCSINSPSAAYTGSAVKPEPTLKFKNSTLKNGVDYTVTYPSNTSSVGTKTATVKGKGAYTGTKTFTYKITAASISGAAVSYTTTHKYTGKAITPAVTVKQNGKTLTKGTDYTVSYSNNINQTTKAAIKVTGKGNYTGTKVVYFTINKTGASAATWTRLAGDDALKTMQTITKAGFSTCDTVVIATMDGYWDALAASALAGKFNAPVLLTASSSLSLETRSEISRLGATKAYICGGKSAVSATVESQVKAVLKGSKTIKRLAGNDALDTAVRIGNEVGSARGDVCIIATAGGYWDALSIAPYSYSAKAPIYLCSGSTLTPGTISAIKAGGFKRVVITGGKYAVPTSVETQLKNNGIKSIKRIAGNDAYHTSGLIADWEYSQSLSADKMAIATASGYWDALGGAAMCGKNGSILVLADDGNRTNITGFAKKHKSEIAQAYVFGGKAVVSDATMNAAKSATK